MAEDDEQKKKLLQDFDENVDYAHMICKRMRKNMKQMGEDIFENITDKQAYSVMFTAHKASKFGQ